MRPVLILAMLLSSHAFAAKPPELNRDHKVDVCHVTGSGRAFTINVDFHSVPAHISHGDFTGSCECEDDLDCDDGAFCNGLETCLSGECLLGEPPCATDCDEQLDECFEPGEGEGEGVVAEGEGEGNDSSEGEDVAEGSPGEGEGEGEGVDSTEGAVENEEGSVDTGEGEGEEFVGEGLPTVEGQPEPDDGGTLVPTKTPSKQDKLLLSGSTLFGCSTTESGSILLLSLLMFGLFAFKSRGALLAFILLLSVPATAEIEPFVKFNSGGDNFIVTSQADTLAKGSVSGNVFLDWGHNPVVLRNSQFAIVDTVIDNHVGFQVAGAVGLSDNFELGFGQHFGAPIGPVLLSDTRLSGKLKLLSFGNLVVAGKLEGTVPLSSMAGAYSPFAGDTIPTITPSIVASTRAGVVRISGELGHVTRIAGRSLPDGTRLGSELTYSVAAQVPLTSNLSLLGDLYGGLGYSGDAPFMSSRLFAPIEGLLALNTKVGQIGIVGGTRVGLLPDVGTPDLGLFLGLNFNVEDKKPASTPVIVQNDTLIVPPKEEVEPELAPQAPPLAVVKDDRIVLLEPVFFAFDKDTILEKSYPVLDSVVEIMKSHTEFRLVLIEGHTDSTGSKAYNVDLSLRRTKSVRQYMVEHGIDASRLNTAGFGEEQPVDTNSTKSGRANNRRVEFKITIRD